MGDPGQTCSQIVKRDRSEAVVTASRGHSEAVVLASFEWAAARFCVGLPKFCSVPVVERIRTWRDNAACFLNTPRGVDIIRATQTLNSSTVVGAPRATRPVEYDVTPVRCTRGIYSTVQLRTPNAFSIRLRGN